MTLKVPKAAARQARAAAERAFPEEFCGVLIGAPPEGFEKPGRSVVVGEIVELPNGWESAARTHRYQLSPKTVLQLEKKHAGTGRGIVGVVHSHPSVPAWPSPFDLMMALPCYSYWIVSVREGRARESRAWMRNMEGTAFLEEPFMEV